MDILNIGNMRKKAKLEHTVIIPMYLGERFESLKEVFKIDVKRKVRRLSKGMQKQVAFWLGICACPKVMVLDEPVAGLDLLATEEMYHIIYDLNRQNGITVIMITHDVDRAVRDATHILHLHKKNIFFGEKAEYLECPECRRFIENEAKENHGCKKEGCSCNG